MPGSMHQFKSTCPWVRGAYQKSQKMWHGQQAPAKCRSTMYSESLSKPMKDSIASDEKSGVGWDFDVVCDE
jgi:hypothetical protein